MPMPLPGRDFNEADHPAASEGVLEKLKGLVGAGSTLWGFDYAWENDSPAQIVSLLTSNSADFAARYLNDPGGKGINRAEAQALQAAGIMICPIWEYTGTDFTGGYSAGLADGKAAAAAMAALGATAGSLIWFTIDTDTSDFTDTNNYLRGAKAGTGSYIAQLYGKDTVCDAAAAAGLGGDHYQTYAWSGGRISPNAALYQYQNGVTIGGISMDRDRTLKTMNGPWAHTGSTPQPPPADWTEQMIMALPTLGANDLDLAGQVQYVHRIQALVRVIGQINSLPAAAVVATDGVYGPQTQAGVKAIQGFFGLSQDGITGQATWHHLVTGG